MKKKILSILLTATVAATLFTGCGAVQGNDVTTPVETKTEAGTASEVGNVVTEEKIPLRVLGWNATVGHFSSVVAYTGGFYEEEGLDVDYTFNNNNPENIQAQLQDKADLTSAGATALLQYIDQGADLVIIGGQMSLGETVYVRPERAEEFKELNEASLAGKKVGVSRLNTGDIVFRKILSEQGVDLSKIEFVELDSQATVTQAIISGEVDLGINFLTFRKTAEANGLVAVSQLDAQDEWPDFICCRSFTTREKLEENRDAYVKALKAHIKAYELYKTDEKAALDAALKGFEIDADVLKDEIYDYGHLGLSPNPDKKNTEKFYQAMVDIGYASGAVNISDYIDTSIYEEALEQLLEEDPTNAVYLELKKESDATNK